LLISLGLPEENGETSKVSHWADNGWKCEAWLDVVGGLLSSFGSVRFNVAAVMFG
jgi:hypothetical protein